MKVAFRADASIAVGSGHVMRCLTLAAALRESGADILFICRDHRGHLCELISEQGFKVARLAVEPSDCIVGPTDRVSRTHADWLGASWHVDASQSVAEISHWGGVDWLVVDHYALDAKWESAVRPVARSLMAIDDLADRPHDCDLLLDQNYRAAGASSYDALVPEHCRKMLGPEFALLRPQFRAARAELDERRAEARRIFVFFGGADPTNETEKAILAILELGKADVQADVLVGSANPNSAAIEKLYSGYPNVHLHFKPSNVAELMARSVLAVGAGGTSTWERLCLGLPSINIAVADNQVGICEALAGDGFITYLGRAESVSVGVLSAAIADALAEIGVLRLKARNGMSLVDGFGTRRVVAFLVPGEATGLSLRRATERDMWIYLDWANDPEVRGQSFTQRPISREAHREWFQQRLSSASSILWLAETDSNDPVGQVRFDETPEGWRIDYSIAAAFRGRRLASPMLEMAIQALSRRAPSGRVFAEVKMDNERSRKALSALGFVETRRSANGAVVYELEWGRS